MLDLRNKSKLYYTFKLKKPNGKFRTICAPCEALKKEQKKIVHKLSKFRLSDSCYGYRKGLSIKDAADMHVNKDWIVTIDVANFFPSIKSDMLWFLCDYEKEVATLKGSLVQGSPSSPIISNIVMRGLDERFSKYFTSLNISYSRYADDICISGFDRLDMKHVHFIESLLKSKGFKVNKEKVNIMFKKDRQEVLGLVLNDCLSVDRAKRRKLRARIHQGFKDNKTDGMLSYIWSINKSQFACLSKM